jgi:hypothetical protein
VSSGPVGILIDGKATASIATFGDLLGGPAIGHGVWAGNDSENDRPKFVSILKLSRTLTELPGSTNVRSSVLSSSHSIKSFALSSEIRRTHRPAAKSY